MNGILRKAGSAIQKVINKFGGFGLDQELVSAEGEAHIEPEMTRLVREAGAESCILLRNNGALPLDSSTEFAVFGRCQLDWFYVGYGSGGNVNAPCKVNLVDGIRNAGGRIYEPVLAQYVNWTAQPANAAYEGWWGHWPFSHPEMPLDGELVSNAAISCDTALCVIGRASGEDRENKLRPGSYYLTRAELDMLEKVCSAFKRVAVVLNIGSMIDLSWLDRFEGRISAVLIAWQGGMESGNAVCDVLFGRVSPCGKLPDTVARCYDAHPSSAHFGGKKSNRYAEDIFVGYRYFDQHPEQRLFRFGFGLSYTTFSVEPKSIRFEQSVSASPELPHSKDPIASPDPAEPDGSLPETAALAPPFSVTVTAEVVNTGSVPGKEVVELYCRQPAGRLEKPVRVLLGFAKTKLLSPGERQLVSVTAAAKYLSSYDSALHAFILEKGEYRFELIAGTNAAADNCLLAETFTVADETVIEQCHAVCSGKVDLKQRILDNMPPDIPRSEGRQLTLNDVADGSCTLSEFVATLSDNELEALTRGHGMMDSPLGTPGNAGTFGGILESLRDKGVPPITTADGPAGLRLKRYCSLLPCGTALASTWNTELIETLHRYVGREMERFGIDVQLAPGMNIHRNPLCGRNFEYFSEDPVLSGKLAAAVIRGVKSAGKASCPKHYACNNQETNRNRHDSIVSERALREIYLRNFEIAVKEAQPLTLMASYNKVNGVWAHYNYDLVTTVLRHEWGYRGVVLTDWWMQKGRSPEFPHLRDNAYRVRAGVDVLMPGNMSRLFRKYRSDGSLLRRFRSKHSHHKRIALGELQAVAVNVLSLILKLRFPKAQ